MNNMFQAFANLIMLSTPSNDLFQRHRSGVNSKTLPLAGSEMPQFSLWSMIARLAPPFLGFYGGLVSRVLRTATDYLMGKGEYAIPIGLAPSATGDCTILFGAFSHHWQGVGIIPNFAKFTTQLR